MNKIPQLDEPPRAREKEFDALTNEEVLAIENIYADLLDDG